MMVSDAQNRFRKGAKSASGAPGPKIAPRGSKSVTFAQGLFQLFNLQQIDTNPIRDRSFDHSNIRYICGSKLQFEKLSELEVGVF